MGLRSESPDAAQTWGGQEEGRRKERKQEVEGPE